MSHVTLLFPVSLNVIPLFSLAWIYTSLWWQHNYTLIQVLVVCMNLCVSGNCLFRYVAHGYVLPFAYPSSLSPEVLSTNGCGSCCVWYNMKSFPSMLDGEAVVLPDANIIQWLMVANQGFKLCYNVRILSEF